MRAARLDLALEAGLLDSPSGAPESIAVYRPCAGETLGALRDLKPLIVTGFAPDAAWFSAQGYSLAPYPDNPNIYEAAVVCLPRARSAARALIAQACDAVLPGSAVLIDGQKTDGIEALYKECRGLGLDLSEALSKAHGKVFTLRGAVPEGWRAAPQVIEGGFQTLPGVFSADAPDAGSALLAQALPQELGAHVIDMGAGWGYLSRAVLSRASVRRLDVVEAEYDALTCARLNLAGDERAHFHWSDARAFTPKPRANAIVMNPPFHTGRDADPELGIAFLRAAARALAMNGTLWLVANRHLPYNRPLADLFRHVDDIGGNGAFRLTRASRPLFSR